MSDHPDNVLPRASGIAQAIRAGLLALLLLLPWLWPSASPARAGSVQTDSWDCIWSGDTWFGSIGWALTSGDPDCATNSALELHYYDGGWGSTGWQDSGISWVQWGHAATAIWSYHWVYVNGHGWSQTEFTQEP